MKDWPETSESLILRVKDPADAAAWSAFPAIYRPVIYRLVRSRGLQDADVENLAQQVLVSVFRTVENWNPEPDGPPFRAWLYRIAHNDCLKAITRRKPDAAVGSSSVQNMFNNPPQNEAEASAQLLHDSRMQAFRWSSEQVRHEFTPTTWTMFWQSTVEERSIDEVAKNHDRSKGAAYLARYRVMKRLLMFVILLSVRVNPAAESGRTGALADPSMRFLIVCSLASTD